jgi:hypothetical protein
VLRRGYQPDHRSCADAIAALVLCTRANWLVSTRIQHIERVVLRAGLDRAGEGDGTLSRRALHGLRTGSGGVACQEFEPACESSGQVQIIHPAHALPVAVRPRSARPSWAEQDRAAADPTPSVGCPRGRPQVPSAQRADPQRAARSTYDTTGHWRARGCGRSTWPARDTGQHQLAFDQPDGRKVDGTLDGSLLNQTRVYTPAHFGPGRSSL